MENRKWGKKLLAVAAVIVFSPLILLGGLIAGIITAIEFPWNRKIYRESLYYKELRVPYSRGATGKACYQFYNGARKRGLPFEYIRQQSNGFEYFVYKNILYFFPDFEQLFFDFETGKWLVSADGDRIPWETQLRQMSALLDKNAPEQPKRVLVERKMVTEKSLENKTLPETVCLAFQFENAFEDGISPEKLCIPQTAKELYDMMIQTPDLCGNFEMQGENRICWKLFAKMEIVIALNDCESYIGVDEISKRGTHSGFMHWHPDASELYEQVCKIGKPGNILLLHSFLGSKSVMYMGAQSDCPDSCKKRLPGKVYCLKAE